MKRQKLLRNLNSKGRLLALLLTAFAIFAVNVDLLAVDFYVCANRSELKAYAWGKNGSKKYFGDWDGAAFSNTEYFDDYGNGWYKSKVDIPDGSGLIFVNSGICQSADLTITSTANVWYFNTCSKSGDKCESNASGTYDASKYTIKGNWDGWATPLTTTFNGEPNKTGFKTTKTFEAGTYEFKWIYNGSTWKNDFASDRCSGVEFSLVDDGLGGKNIQFTLASKGDMTFYIDPKGDGTCFATFVAASSGDAPTVLIAGAPDVSGSIGTLFGYIKYTGCQDVTDFGFVWSTDEAVIRDTPSDGTQATATSPEKPIASGSYGTDFQAVGIEFTPQTTIYYRAYATNSVGTSYSEEIRSFSTAGDCNITDEASVLPIFESGKITESATFIESSASIDLTVEKESIADVYHWNVSPDAGVSFSAQTSRNTSVTVSAVGTYTFTLTAGCTDGTQYTSERTLTLYVCEPAETTQLYLDNHTVNVLCAGEKATATCITKEGYTYSLFSPSGDNLGSLPGTGGTQTWRNVTGAGEFTMRTSPDGMSQCAAVVSSAVQRYNEPTMEITAEPALSVLSYQPVILSKKASEADTYVDTNPTWVITNGSDKAYLLNEHNRLAYDNRARESVVLKAGAGIATQITIEASAYKTVEVPDASGDYTKQCPATVDVTLTVSPAVDDCE